VLDFLVEQLGIGLLISVGRRAVIQPRTQDIVAELRRVDPACLPVTIRHEDDRAAARLFASASYTVVCLYVRNAVP